MSKSFNELLAQSPHMQSFYGDKVKKEVTYLISKHNSGFFSCCTIALIDVIKYFNQHKQLPDIFDRSEQFVFYKADPSIDLIPDLFSCTQSPITYEQELVVTNEPGEISFGDYSKINFDKVRPFVQKYFSPSDKVCNIIEGYINKYQIDLDNTCAIFYRGNDKQRECNVTSYAAFIEKACTMPGTMRFMVMPDETEFYHAFTSAFPGRCFTPEECPHMRKKNSAIFYELPANKKQEHAMNFFASVVLMGSCGKVIMHSGNGAMWLALYRGGMEGVHQFMTKHKY